MTQDDPSQTTQALQYWAATWNEGPLPEVSGLVKFMDDLNFGFCFQKEKGETTERAHYQMRINLKTKDRRMTKLTLLSIFHSAYDVAQLTLRPESNNGLKKDALAFYVMKNETRIDGPWMDKGFKAPEAPYEYTGKDLQMMGDPLLWQKEILQMMEKEPDDRTVTWICQRAGNAGKSKLQKWLCWKKKAKRISMGLAHQIKNAFCVSKARYKTYVMNIPRVVGKEEAQRELFSAIEEIKDGWVSAVMYGEEKECFFEPPHIFVFSNELPNLGLCSADRWQLYEFEDKASQLKKVDPQWVDVEGLTGTSL